MTRGLVGLNIAYIAYRPWLELEEPCGNFEYVSITGEASHWEAA